MFVAMHWRLTSMGESLCQRDPETPEGQKLTQSEDGLGTVLSVLFVIGFINMPHMSSRLKNKLALQMLDLLREQWKPFLICHYRVLQLFEKYHDL